jgi:LEA14-like dessication related protein
MNSRFLIFILLASLLYSCTSIEEPTLERVEDVKILTLNKSKVEINANMILKNPNSFALDLEKAELVAMLDDVEVANIDQTYETEMPARSEFKMPVYINMDLDRLYNDNPLQALAKGLEIMSDRSLDVRFMGTIKAGKSVAKISVKVDQMETVNF